MTVICIDDKWTMIDDRGKPFPLGLLYPREGQPYTVTDKFTFANTDFYLLQEHPGFGWEVDHFATPKEMESIEKALKEISEPVKHGI